MGVFPRRWTGEDLRAYTTTGWLQVECLLRAQGTGARISAVTSDRQVCLESQESDGERQIVKAAQLLTFPETSPWSVAIGVGVTLVAKSTKSSSEQKSLK